MHDTTNVEKMKFLEYIRALTLGNILKKEDVEEICKILIRACDRDLPECNQSLCTKDEKF